MELFLQDSYTVALELAGCVVASQFDDEQFLKTSKDRFMPPKSNLKIGDISAQPGTKARGFLAVPNTSVQLPVVVVNGAQEGQTLLVTAGIHGGEYPCIEAGIRFGRD